MTDNRTNEPKQTETKSGQAFCFSEAQVEVAAKAMWDLRKSSLEPEWDVLDVGVKQEYRKDARAALVAAAGVAPQAVSVDDLAEVIASSEAFGLRWEQVPPMSREAYRKAARAVLAHLGGESR